MKRPREYPDAQRTPPRRDWAASLAATPAAPATAAPATAAPSLAPINISTAIQVPTFVEILPTEVQTPPLTPTLQPTGSGNISIQDQFAQIDAFLRQNTQASIAFNSPKTMRLDETIMINLLMNPSLSDQQLATQVTGI